MTGGMGTAALTTPLTMTFGTDGLPRLSAAEPVVADRGMCKMLVLSRQRDESIIIGDNVVVTIVDVRGDRVRLGIEAPREVSVHRREVYEAIQRENREASQIQPEQARRISDDPPKAR